MTEMIFDTCQRLGGIFGSSAGLYCRKVANHFFRSKYPTIPQSFWNTLYHEIWIDISGVHLNFQSKLW
jgi:hypothetical protein